LNIPGEFFVHLFANEYLTHPIDEGYSSQYDTPLRRKNVLLVQECSMDSAAGPRLERIPFDRYRHPG